MKWIRWPHLEHCPPAATTHFHSGGTLVHVDLLCRCVSSSQPPPYFYPAASQNQRVPHLSVPSIFRPARNDGRRLDVVSVQLPLSGDPMTLEAGSVVAMTSACAAMELATRVGYKSRVEGALVLRAPSVHRLDIRLPMREGCAGGGSRCTFGASHPSCWY